MTLHSSKPQHKELGLMCSGSMDDADKAGPFLSETSSHPTSNTLHSGFCLQDDVSI